jgi:hypothetical protein
LLPVIVTVNMFTTLTVATAGIGASQPAALVPVMV